MDEYFNTDVREAGWDGVDWIRMAHSTDRWRAVLNTAMNFQVGKFCTVLSSLYRAYVTLYILLSTNDLFFIVIPALFHYLLPSYFVVFFYM